MSKGRHRREIIGQSLTWLCGGALAFNLLLVIGILALLAWNGLGFFWQKDLLELTLKDGRKVLGEVWDTEKAETAAQTGGAPIDRIRLKIGNRDVEGLDFAWSTAKTSPRCPIRRTQCSWNASNGETSTAPSRRSAPVKN
jgi:ABC-type phosphate transport system auxiliary subunit